MIRPELRDELDDHQRERLRRARLETIPAGLRHLSPLYTPADAPTAATGARSGPS